jgi:hypothetical protein
LLGDAVHHLNNPLNHIQGVSRTLADSHKELMDQFESMLPPEAERDSMADTIISQFKSRFSELDATTTILSTAVGRASDTVVSLRVLSGVDGVSYEPTTFDTIWQGFVRRSPQVSKFFSVDFASETLAYRCHGTAVAYAIAIELILVRIQQLELEVSRIVLEPGEEGDADEPSFWSLEFRLSEALKDEDWLRTQTAVGYLLRPYWCEAHLRESVLVLDILKKMPEAFS